MNTLAIEHINEFDTLNAGREKINKHAIDPANRAELNSIDAKSVANQANQKSQSAEAIAINTDDRLDNIIAGEMQDAEVIDARRPFGSETYATLGERLDEEKAEIDEQLYKNGIDIRALGAKANDQTFDNKQIIEYAINTFKRIAINDIFYTSPITTEIECTIEGEGTLIAIDTQTYILHAKKPIQILGKIFMDGVNKASNGLVLESASRSNFYDIKVQKCKRWGVFFSNAGNNNLIKFGKLDVVLCGEEIQVNFKQVGLSGGSTSVQRYGIMQLESDIDFEGVYFAKVGTTYHKVQFDSANQMRIYHLDIGNEMTGVATLLRGGAIDISKHGDNNDAYFNTLDIRLCPVGLHCNAQYGAQINNPQIQACKIAFSTSDYTYSMVITRPYLEIVEVNLLVWEFMHVTIIEPGGDFNFRDKTYSLIYDTPKIENLTLISGGDIIQSRVKSNGRNSASVLEVKSNNHYTIEQQTNAIKKISIVNDDFFSQMDGAPIYIYPICVQAGGQFKLEINTKTGALVENLVVYEKTVTDRQKITLIMREGAWRVF